MDELEELAAPLKDLPIVEFAFAYGSGVFQQPGHSDLSKQEAPMVDYILGVTCPEEWHSQNIERNPHHYTSWLSHFGGKGVSLIADRVGVGVHFNAFVPWKGKMIKYGVMSMNNLVQDILRWQQLYISGRLQKPVRILVDNWELAKVNQVNLQSAVCAALLLLPAQFSEEDLYIKIGSLSYMGDVRMLFAEDKDKVCRIVRGSSEYFHALYRIPLYHMAASGFLELPTSFGHLDSIFVKDCSPAAVESLLSSLPSAVLARMPFQLSHIIEHKNAGIVSPGEKVVIKSDYSRPLQRAIRSIVRTSSIRQILSGFLAAGCANSASYVLKKSLKAWRSRF
eukprot:c38974_g1_i1 orf=282-1292(+)